MDKFSSSHISEIKSIIRDFHSDDNQFRLDKFNEEVHKFLHELFQKSFGVEYLYSTLLFVKEDTIQKHRFLFNESLKPSGIKDYVINIQPLFSRILRIKKQTIGISNHLVKNKVNGLVLYDSKNPKIKNKATVYNKIKHSYDLKNISIKDDLLKKINKLSFNETEKNILNFLPNSLLKKIPDELLDSKTYSNLFKNDINEKELKRLHQEFNIDGDIETLKPILTLYKIANPKVNKDDCFIYFIRPNTEHKYFDGLINFSLNRHLLDRELSVLNLILYYIFSEVAIKEYKRDTKNAEWKDIVDNLAHSQNNIYTYLHEKALTQKAQFDEIFVNPKKKHQLIDDYKSSSLELIENLSLLEKTNRINLAIGKYTINNTKEGLKKELKEIITPENFNLKNVIEDICKILLLSMKSYNLEDDIHIEKAIPVLREFIKKELSKFNNIRLFAPKTALFVIVLELFKNLIEHSKREKPYFDILIERDNNFLKLCFDNKNLSPSYLNLINRKNKIEKINYGLRTVFRVIESGILDSLPVTETNDNEWGLYGNTKDERVELQIPLKYSK